MPETIGFRPTKEFWDRLENYMAIHHLNDKSEAMRAICKEWHEQKRELETLRDHLKKKAPQLTETMKPIKQPIKQRIKVTQGIMWITCPKDNQAHRINDCHNCNDPKFSNCKEAVKKYMEA